MSRAVLRVRRTYIIMREKVDILPLKGRTDDLPNPNRAKPEMSEKGSGRKKPGRPRAKKAKK
jgi:hypothetical protein